MLRDVLRCVGLCLPTGLCGLALAAPVVIEPAALGSAADAAPVDVEAALARARIVGIGDQVELIVPLEVPAWAAELGVTGRERVFKGVCGPDGAVATPDQLFEEARRNLDREFNNRGGGAEVTVDIGTSPRFRVTYDAANGFIPLFLPSLTQAAEFVDGQLDNRVTIGVDFDVRALSGSTIGSAGSDRFSIPWSTYVEGLRSQSAREGDQLPLNLPTASLPVLFDSQSDPANATSVTQMKVTEAQLRAVFGDNALPQGAAVSVTYNSNTSWAFSACDSLSGSQQSLVDVAVHEFTHPLGFTSSIAAGGNNGDNSIQGLDVARFRFSLVPPNLGVPGGPPLTNAQFTSFPRLGEQFFFDIHQYQNVPDGFSTQLEEGNIDPGLTSFSQPSHLSYRADFEDKLGIMDPVSSRGETRCTSFWTAADIGPLDDMGWRPIAANLFADCNSNGVFDIFDLPITGDVDGDNIPDTCENFLTPIAVPSEPNGLRGIFYSAPAGTDLSSFDPAASAPLIEQFIEAGPNFVATFSSPGTRVSVLKGAIFAPAKDEYAFRVGHLQDDMMLFIGGQLLLDLDGPRSLTRSNSSTALSPQRFVHLDQGWHTFELRLLSTGTEVGSFVEWDARNFGDGGVWPAVTAGDTRALGFVDCDGNSIADVFDPDCDSDGTPDACERDCDSNGVPDECENGAQAAVDLGTVGFAGQVTLDTCGSDFDTELALWDDQGNLVAEDDDGTLPGCNFRTSSITRTLDAGTYFAAAAGFNTAFGSNFDASPGSAACSVGGSLNVHVGSFSETVPLGDGRVRFYMFTIGEPDCDGDGTPDSQELDCDSNGTPDDCENGVGFAGDAGIVGNNLSPIVITSNGSDFDTEIGLWNEAGDLLASDDDGGDGLQSRIEMMLEPGVYFCSFSGFNSFFDDGFSRTNLACTAGGLLVAAIGDQSDSATLAPGRDVFVRFEVESAGDRCSLADVVEPFGTLDIDDVLAFLGAFSVNDPLADVAPPMGSFDIDDVLLFLQTFSQGCP